MQLFFYVMYQTEEQALIVPCVALLYAIALGSGELQLCSVAKAMAQSTEAILSKAKHSEGMSCTFRKVVSESQTISFHQSVNYFKFVIHQFIGKCILIRTIR